MGANLNSTFDIVLFFKMLVIFGVAPCSAPSESVLDEETVAEIVAGDDAWALSLVGVGSSVAWGNVACTEGDSGVETGVDVDGNARGVLGELTGACYGAVAVAGGVVG